MVGARVYPWVLATAALVGCGSEAPGPAAPSAGKRVIALGWVERSADPELVFRVERLTVAGERWEVRASVENRTRDDFQIRRPHRPHQSLFGLVLLRTTDAAELRKLTAGFRKEPPFLAAGRIDPPLAGSLRAGATWRGTMSGAGVLRRGAVVRVIFGRFTRERRPQVITWVTEHAVRL